MKDIKSFGNTLEEEEKKKIRKIIPLEDTMDK